MAKIPFDIEFRPQIESGEYKVETRDGKPARILCWDKVDEFGQYIVALVQYTPEHENMISVCEDGIYKGTYGHGYDLFIITPEPELSEFEKAVGAEIFDTPFNAEQVKVIREESMKLLSLAKDEIYSHESLVEYAKKAKADGKAEALKDLPRWKKATGKERFNERMIVLAGDNDLLCTNYAEEGEYYISFSVLEKLPKED